MQSEQAILTVLEEYNSALPSSRKTDSIQDNGYISIRYGANHALRLYPEEDPTGKTFYLNAINARDGYRDTYFRMSSRELHAILTALIDEIRDRGDIGPERELAIVQESLQRIK
jgi:hypothetical protein